MRVILLILRTVSLVRRLLITGLRFFTTAILLFTIKFLKAPLPDQRSPITTSPVTGFILVLNMLLYVLNLPFGARLYINWYLEGKLKEEQLKIFLPEKQDLKSFKNGMTRQI